ncbi:glycosyltransferase family 4 protein [Pedobacter sp. P26]|uniref:glycosyltransferase family 4 protein n=1 Tax=Pedobacter sp. P26 TaxID=3423956 RepID=UPI003D663DCF
MEKILLACTVPALESYNIGIINAALSDRNMAFYAVVFLNGQDKRSDAELMADYGVAMGKRNRIQFYHLSENKVIRILSGSKYLDLVVQFASKELIAKIHFISQDVMLSPHLVKFKNFELYYTVHDFVAHPAKLNPLQRAKHYYFRIRKDRLLIEKINNLVTNSSSQHRALLKHYPGKKVSWHRMPGMVTRKILNGNKEIPELKEVEDYVLFFGRIEIYKGLASLYNLFLNRSELSGTTLVIAGKGNVYFDRNPAKEDNIVFLNRFIAEEEVAALFKKAKFLVLPYLSATQSAISSISYHFRKPVIASLVEGLAESVDHEHTGLLYSGKEPDQLLASILRLCYDAQLREKISKNLKDGPQMYDVLKLQEELALVYQNNTL